MDHDLDPGAYLSYSCAEFIPFMSEERLHAAAAHSFVGDLRVRAQRRACSIWNVRPAAPSFNDAVRSDVSALILTGSDDPATPPRYAAEELPYLPNARQILVRGAGHGIIMACTARLVTEFVRAGSANGLDLSQCSQAFARPHFALSMAGWPQI